MAQTIALSNGHLMPIFGLGTWQAKQAQPDQVRLACVEAIKAGYRLIDTAAAYQNENEVGQAVKECIAAGIIKRSDIFITTKCFITTLHPDKVEPALRGSLERLGMDFVDLYLAHMPVAFNPDFTQDPSVSVEMTWKALESVYKKGLTRAIGVSNYSIDQIERVMKIAEVPIHNQQVELHLYFPQFEMASACLKHNISLTSYSTLGNPSRMEYKTPDGRPNPFFEAPADLDDAYVKELAKKYNKSPAQILLRYCIERNIAVIPKSVTPSRVRENFQVFDFKLTADEMGKLRKPAHTIRLYPQDFMKGHPEDFLKHER
ncbi:unnamed protein product, partial [Mesorhabditis belari]|uniref:NADP-dependent oxidoreductase domain-containing protein n=1 Tax=Mesorhabditis belari TaxID=2138241 RepID=A0AAF3FAA0_9BILA